MSEEKIRNYKQAGIQGPGSQSIPSFLLKTYEILQNSKYCDVICWTKNGEGFVVKKVKEFAQNILPTHFRHSNYTSFVRQLNMYDFHKTRQENQQNAFKNSMFKRGQKNLLKQIQRKDYKKKKEKPDSYEKVGAVFNENQSATINKQDKKVQEAKQLHQKIVSTLKNLLVGIQDKQNKLSHIASGVELERLDEKVSKNPEGLCRMMDTLYECKNFNSDSQIKIDQICKQWQNLLAIKQKNMVKYETNHQEDLKKQQPTVHTLKSFMEHQKRNQ